MSKLYCMYKLIKLLLFKSNLRGFILMKFKPSRFTDPHFEIRVRVNRGKLTKGKFNLFELATVELA